MVAIHGYHATYLLPKNWTTEYKSPRDIPISRQLRLVAQLYKSFKLRQKRGGLDGKNDEFHCLTLSGLSTTGPIGLQSLIKREP